MEMKIIFPMEKYSKFYRVVVLLVNQLSHPSNNFTLMTNSIFLILVLIPY